MKQMVDFNKQQIEILKQLSCNRQPREIVDEDDKLSNWLEGLGINEVAKRIFLAEGYTLEEVRIFLSLKISFFDNNYEL